MASLADPPSGTLAGGPWRPVFHDPFLHASPLADEMDHFLWRRRQEPVFYFPLSFFAFAHELGHHADPDMIPALSKNASLSEAAVLARLEEFARNTEADWSALSGVASWEPERQDEPGEISRQFRSKAPSWVGELRSEILADHVAAQLIWRVCVDATAQESGGRPRIDAFFTDTVMSLVSLLLCQTVARAISLDGLQDTDKVQALVTMLRYSAYTGIRAAALIDTLTLSPDLVGIALRAKERRRLAGFAEDLGKLAQALVQASLDCVDRVGRARHASAEEIVRQLALISPTRAFNPPDVEAFWGAVDRMDLWESTDILAGELAELKAERARLRDLRREAEARRAEPKPA